MGSLFGCLSRSFNVAIPVLFLYAIGIIIFILAIEEKELPNNIIYLGLAFLINGMGYYLSYSNTDYTLSAYFPLVISMLTIVILIYRAFGMIPHSISWDEETDRD